jgi:hypothetical protein
LTIKELDRLFDNGYTVEEYGNAPPIIKLFMLGERQKGVKFFNEDYKVRQCNSWVLIGFDGENEVWKDKNNHFYKGYLN